MLTRGLCALVARAAVEKQGSSHQEACKNFWISDKQGLVTEERPALSEVVKPFARYSNQGDVDGESLLDTIKRVRSSPQGSRLKTC